MKLEVSIRRFRGELRRPAARDNFMRYDKRVYTRRPTSRQGGAFKAGWGAAQAVLEHSRKSYRPATLRRLTWCNLGYRFVTWMGLYSGRQEPGDPAKAFEVFKRVFSVWKPPPPSTWISREVEPPDAHRLKYIFVTEEAERCAAKAETKLVRDYRSYLKGKDRELKSRRWEGNLQCDGYEKARKNLIEAKALAKREHIRMAVGELFDYAFFLKQEFGEEPNKAILLPQRPKPELVEWLRGLKIALVWRVEKGVFKDDSNEQFT